MNISNNCLNPYILRGQITMSQITLVDEQDMLLNEMKERMASYPQYTFISEKSFGNKELARISYATDLVIIVAKSKINIHHVVEQYKEQNKKVAIWIANEDKVSLNTIFHMEVDGYISNKVSSSELNFAIHSILTGNQYIDRHISSILLRKYNRLTSGKNNRPNGLLTDREWDILEQIVKGMKNEGIANTLHLSPRTVKNHIVSIFSKLGVDNRTSAALSAVRNGWVEI